MANSEYQNYWNVKPINLPLRSNILIFMTIFVVVSIFYADRQQTDKLTLRM